MQSETKVVRDPLHDYIGLTAHEVSIIDSPLFQRLRRISQLGQAELVYPTATHSRFEHSLGVMSVSAKMAHRLRLTEAETRLVRLAGLLHDIGHGPFSHTMREWNRSQWTETVITDSEITDIIRSAGCAPEEVLRVIQGTHRDPLLAHILNGPIDADQLDYLQRDSYYMGIPAGNIDSDHIVMNLVSTESGPRAIAVKSSEAFADYCLARYVMYSSVYYHRAVRIADLLLSRIVSLLIDTDAVSLPKDLQEFQDFDDVFVWSKIREAYRQSDDVILRTLSGWLQNRQLPKVVWHQFTDAKSIHERREFDQKDFMDYIARKLEINNELLFFERLTFPRTKTLPFIPSVSTRTHRTLRQQFSRYEGSISRAYAPSEKAKQAARIATSFKKPMKMKRWK
jgi:HD superfamily phosphohydrolase